jgi:phosphate transport system permease protein
LTQPPSTGARRRKTRPSVRVAERVSRALITVGGIGTIVAVTLILVFLVWVVLPLFAPAEVATGPRQALDAGPAPAQLVIDEYGLLAGLVGADGSVRVVRLDDGTLVETRQLFDGTRPTAVSFSVDGTSGAFALPGGDVRIGELAISSRFVESGALPPAAAGLAVGQVLTHAGTVLSHPSAGIWREHAFQVAWREPIETGLADAIVQLDHIDSGNRTVLCALTEGGALTLIKATSRPDMLTGKVAYRVNRHELPTGELQGRPSELALLGIGDTLLALFEDGRTVRMDVRDPAAAQVAQKLDLVPEAGARVTASGFMLGRSTLVVGDSLGQVRAWFLIKPEDAGTLDGALLVQAHELEPGGAAAVALAASPRSRTLLAGYADGRLCCFNVTSATTLATLEAGEPPRLVAFSPKENTVFALTGQHLAAWSLDLRHPEASTAALFEPMWYEEHERPMHVWQSSGGTDDFEPKLGLTPLVFGTFKATFYSMLFGAPIALLAAIYTSEFLNRRLRTSTKSVIEMMASLPSVVLGFLSALVIAPFVQSALPETLALFVTFPFTIFTAAYLWQLLPRPLGLRLKGLPRLVCMFLTLPAAIQLAIWSGPRFERTFFSGDIRAWLTGQVGSSVGGWLFLLLPLSVLVVTLAMARFVGPWLRRVTADWSYGRCARFDLLRYGVGLLATVGLALAGGNLLDALGFDPRGLYLGTYVSHNALVVGFVMGFAIVPLIYTLAEDALSSVPDHLRLASLGAGATQWQTAVRVVVPTAMSGLFSAVMIGLGRAVGETMIVLMATGNTPIMDWNMFNGFRTLSANIAYELPEAVRDSTHYRVLFLAALVLFAMTFVLNTVAELVRQRFRKRAYQL